MESSEKTIVSTPSLNQTQPLNQQVHELESIPLLDMQDTDFPKKIVNTFRQIGFVIVTNHGIEPKRIDEAFDKSKEFFMLNKEVKSAIKFNPAVNRGYMGAGAEVLDQKDIKNDKKETLDLGHPNGPDELQYYPQIANFNEVMARFYEDLFKIHVRVLQSIEEGLGLQKGYIVDKCAKQFYNQSLRLLYYPQVPLESIKKAGVVRAGAHSDYGTITLLFQKPGFGQNGLRALNSQKHWVKVQPPDYSMVINLGDLFQHWSNDQLISTIHKVEVDEKVMSKLEKKELEVAPERQTIVMFCDPDANEMFECMPNCGAPKYPPIDGKLYVLGRIKATVDFKM